MPSRRVVVVMRRASDRTREDRGRTQAVASNKCARNCYSGGDGAKDRLLTMAVARAEDARCAWVVELGGLAQ